MVTAAPIDLSAHSLVERMSGDRMHGELSAYLAKVELPGFQPKVPDNPVPDFLSMVAHSGAAILSRRAA